MPDAFSFGQLSLRAETLNEEDRSVSAVVATDQPVPMYDMMRGAMVDEILVGNGGEFPERVPLLDSHVRESVDDIRGSAEGFTLTDGKWVGRLRFDDDEPSQRAFQKVRKGFLTDVSVGYRVAEAAEIDPGKTQRVAGVEYQARGRVLRVATRWQAREVSLAAIGADDQAKIRTFAMAKRHPIGERLAGMVDASSIDRETLIADLASAAGITKEHVRYILAGVVGDLTRSQIAGFAAALEVPADVITGESNA